MVGRFPTAPRFIESNLTIEKVADVLSNAAPIEALSAAIRLVSEYLIPMAQRIYGDLASSTDDRAVETLARWIIQTKATEVHVRQIQRHERLQGLTTAIEIHKACRALVRAGWLSPPGRGSNQGRAKQVYRPTSALAAAFAGVPYCDL
jgi:hypothetical protein